MTSLPPPGGPVSSDRIILMPRREPRAAQPVSLGFARPIVELANHRFALALAYSAKILIDQGREVNPAILAGQMGQDAHIKTLAENFLNL